MKGKMTMQTVIQIDAKHCRPCVQSIAIFGRPFYLVPLSNGALELLPADGGNIAENEWEEYCQVHQQQCQALHVKRLRNIELAKQAREAKRNVQRGIVTRPENRTMRRVYRQTADGWKLHTICQSFEHACHVARELTSQSGVDHCVNS